MENQHKDRWLELAEAASKEHDPEKLRTIVAELKRALDEREKQLRLRPSE